MTMKGFFELNTLNVLIFISTIGLVLSFLHFNSKIFIRIYLLYTKLMKFRYRIYLFIYVTFMKFLMNDFNDARKKKCFLYMYLLVKYL